MAQHEDIFIDQGASFKGKISITNADDGTNFDMTGYTGSGSIKKTYSSAAITTFTCLNVGNGLHITLTPAETDLLVDEAYLYDIKIVSNDKTYRPIRGNVYVTKKVT